MEKETTPTEEERMTAAVEQVLMELALKGGAPSGHLYADVMDTLSLEQWLHLLNRMEEKGLVRVRGHYVTWLGPTL